MIQLKNINIQVNTIAMLLKLNSNIDLSIDEKENAIVNYDENLRKDIFYSELTEDDKIVWNSYIDVCLILANISKDNLGQVINQYELNRIIINTIDILVDSSKQVIIDFTDLTNEELLSLNNFNQMIKNKL